MILAVVVVVSAAVVAVAWVFRPQPAPPAPIVAKTASVLDERLLSWVVVTLKSGTTFAGVLYAEDTGAVVLCKAEHVTPDGSKVSADGEIVLLRGDIDFIQRP